MRDVVRRLRLLRLPASAGKRGLPLTLAAFAVIAGASTAASTAAGAGGSTVNGAPAGATVLPPAVPPTYSYPGSTGSIPGVPTAPPTDGTGSTAGPAAGTPGGEAAPQLAANGIPARAVQAYKAAAAGTPSSCGVPWTLVAAIGRVESNHGQFAGATLLADGRSDPPIVGIPLDGRPGVAQIGDTDGGKYDGDTVHDRAVGPMQFIPGTWSLFAADGDHDGKSDPFDIDDAAAAAANYLCRAGGDLSTETGQRNAVYSYNRSDSYVALVLALSAQYAGGAPIDDSPAPNGSPRPLPPMAQPTLPPVTIGPPQATSTTTPKPKPTTPAPTTTRPATPSPSPTRVTPTPSPSTSPSASPTTPSPSPTTPSPSPTCTPAPSPSPSPSGSISPNGTAASASAAASAAAASAETAAPAGTTSATAAATPTATPTPTPTLPTCPTP
jgi:outer membrane biosynthesis protein TonB